MCKNILSAQKRSLSHYKLAIIFDSKFNMERELALQEPSSKSEEWFESSYILGFLRIKKLIGLCILNGASRIDNPLIFAGLLWV